MPDDRAEKAGFGRAYRWRTVPRVARQDLSPLAEAPLESSPVSRSFRSPPCPLFYPDPRLQDEVRVDTPNPLFAKRLPRAIGGIEGARAAGPMAKAVETLKDVLS